MNHRGMNNKSRYFKSMIKVVAPCAAAILTVGCSKVAEPTYSLTATLTPEDEGMMAYIINYDSGEPIDSAIITDGRAEFSGALTSPVLARLIVDNTRRGSFILEEGSVTFDGETRTATGGELNATLNRIDSIDTAFGDEMSALNPADSLYQSSVEQIKVRRDSVFKHLLKENAGNPVGYYLFIQDAYEMDMPTLDSQLKEYPQFGTSERIKKLRASLAKKAETSPGHKYKDFAIEYGDSVSRLSDYVDAYGKEGKYTLVDFWASWCGPCIRATKTIKELYQKFGPNGTGQLEVVGVAVWDEQAKTLEAIKSHGLTWPQIIDAKTVPTDLYGISGIPCIMLIGPDGTILVRDLQGTELVNAVEEALKGTKE